ncbi:unnamed protein product [Caenorhabditis sp. 36 PRJEB53466]|nr:unnamed protein product [Caenorhabditis sp. 36 PRJEB53466]
MGDNMHDKCAAEFGKSAGWVWWFSAVPIVVNLITLGLIGASIYGAQKMNQLCRTISTSAQRLACTAVRIGVGESARAALAEHAKTKPELEPLSK